MSNNKPILITGSHRSGSTWVGKMIAKSAKIGYIHEPFNLNQTMGVCGAKFTKWFQYISNENQDLFVKHIRKTLNFSYNLGQELQNIRTPKNIVKMLIDYNNFTKNRILKRRPLIKDPIALFSAEWLASEFDMNVIILIRHPAAFASSLKRLNWQFSFKHLLEQNLLMDKYLYPFEAEMNEFVKKEKDIIDQAGLLWKIIHYVILKYKQNYENWLFLRHEDISLNPTQEFEDIFNKIDLEYTASVRKKIKKYSNNSNPKEPTRKYNNIKRNSKYSIKNWKSKLSPTEIKKIRNIVEEISVFFYSDEDW